jgi:hypothetical protein
VADDEIGRENAALRGLVAVYRHLSTLAAQDSGIEAVTELIAERMDATVAVVDEKMTVLAAASPGGGAEGVVRERVVHPRLAQVLALTGRSRRAARIPDVSEASPMIVAPVLVGDEVPAYLLTLHDGDPETGEDLRLLVTEHAATICGVILGRERVVAAAAARAREDLIEGLLSGKGSDADEVLRWARHLGYDEAREHRVLSLVVEEGHDGLGARVPVAIERFFGTQASDAITAVRDHEVVVVLPDRADGADRAESLTASCLDRVRELFPLALVTVGIGGRCGPPEGIARSYDDARRTVEAARRMGRTGSIVAFDELGIHRLLLQVADPAQLREFAHEVFGGLSNHPRAAVAEYLTTLGCYFRANNSPQRASRALHVHPNTVTYRVRRVEQITKLDFTHYRDRLMAQVALEILDAVGDGPPAVSPLRTGRVDDL